LKLPQQDRGNLPNKDFSKVSWRDIMKERYQRIEIFLGRLFISVIIFFLFFFVIDVISREFISARSPIEQLYPVEYVRHPRPYSMFAGKPSVANLNSLGYRGDVPQMPKPADEYRIIFLGGSTVYFGNPSISTLVEEIFKQNGIHHIKVYNFGVMSSVSGMELARIVFEVLDLAPDMIVMYNGGNDILQPLLYDPRPGYPFNFIAYENNPLLDKNIKNYPSTALLMYGSNIMRHFFRNYFVEKFVPLESVRKRSKFKSDEWKDEIANIYVGNLIKANKVSNVFGAEFIAFYQPSVYFKDVLSDKEQYYKDDEKSKFVKEISGRIITKIALSQKENEIRFIDLSGIYKNNPNWVFMDDLHTIQAAKSIVAQAVAQAIYKKNVSSPD